MYIKREREREREKERKREYPSMSTAFLKRRSAFVCDDTAKAVMRSPIGREGRDGGRERESVCVSERVRGVCL